jgi:hypothetical protein
MGEEKESETYVEFSRIVDVALRDDGEEVKIVCQGDDGEQFDMLIPTEAVISLSIQLEAIGRSARVSKTAFRPVLHREPRFGEPPPCFAVTDISGVVYSESGQIDLQIQPLNGPAFQVKLLPEHAKALFDLLLKVYNLDDQKPS